MSLIANLEELHNRFTYHPPTPEQIEKYTEIRDTARNFAILLEGICPDSREKALALTNLDQTVFWANAAIARRT